MSDDNRTFDDIDLRILHALQENARISNAEIARRVAMAPSAVLERVRKLEERGAIRGYAAEVDARMVGRGLLAFVFVRGDEPPGSSQLGEQLSALPGVQEVHHVAGEDCFLVKARVTDTAALGVLLREGIGRLEAVRSTRSTIVLDTVKEDARIELPEVSG